MSYIDDPNKLLARKLLHEPGQVDHDLAAAIKDGLTPEDGALMGERSVAGGNTMLTILRDLRDIEGYPIHIPDTIPSEGSVLPERLGLTGAAAQVRLEDAGIVTFDPANIEGFYDIKGK